MNNTIKHITTPKTARYFLHGCKTDDAEEIWFICHGYGHLANYFLSHFKPLEDGRTLLVAPEGLHRFYVNDVSGRVGATWMTKEDRQNDIKDYVYYLDAVYKEVLQSVKSPAPLINVLGFSQGAATACRWLSGGQAIANNLVLWAGLFPSEFDFKHNDSLIKSMNIFLVLGDKDEYISGSQLKEHTDHLNRNNVKFQLIEFEGKHEINQEALMKIKHSCTHN